MERKMIETKERKMSVNKCVTCGKITGVMRPKPCIDAKHVFERVAAVERFFVCGILI